MSLALETQFYVLSEFLLEKNGFESRFQLLSSTKKIILKYKVLNIKYGFENYNYKTFFRKKSNVLFHRFWQKLIIRTWRKRELMSLSRIIGAV